QGIIRITLHSAQDVGREIFFSVTIIILAYMPILLMTRVEGKLFSPMALTLAFAVIGSMLCALTLIPVLISFAYRKSFEQADHSQPHKDNILLRIIDKAYTLILKPILKFPRTALAIGFALI